MGNCHLIKVSGHTISSYCRSWSPKPTADFASFYVWPGKASSTYSWDSHANKHYFDREAALSPKCLRYIWRNDDKHTKWPVSLCGACSVENIDLKFRDEEGKLKPNISSPWQHKRRVKPDRSQYNRGIQISQNNSFFFKSVLLHECLYLSNPKCDPHLKLSVYIFFFDNFSFRRTLRPLDTRVTKFPLTVSWNSSVILQLVRNIYFNFVLRHWLFFSIPLRRSVHTALLIMCHKWWGEGSSGRQCESNGPMNVGREMLL
jgi:hypothetical protein